MKRFYSLVSVYKGPEGYEIQLDGRSVKTQSGRALLVQNEKVAQRIMCEWNDQTDEIDPNAMPFTQIINTMMDRVSFERASMRDYVMRYLDTDLLCYLAEQPEELRAEQDKNWTPIRSWFEEYFGHKLQTTVGLSALRQEDSLHQAIARYVDALDDQGFTLLQIVTAASGSLILALAMMERQVNADQVMLASFIEEDYKDTLYDAEKYGSDPAIEKKKKSTRIDLEAVQDYLAMLMQ